MKKKIQTNRLTVLRSEGIMLSNTCMMTYIKNRPGRTLMDNINNMKLKIIFQKANIYIDVIKFTSREIDTLIYLIISKICFFPYL